LDIHPETDNPYNYETENIAFTTTEAISEHSCKASATFLLNFFTKEKAPKF
jgi:hypothetical protein